VRGSWSVGGAFWAEIFGCTSDSEATNRARPSATSGHGSSFPDSIPPLSTSTSPFSLLQSPRTSACRSSLSACSSTMTLWRQTPGAASDERSPLLPNQPSDIPPAALVDQAGRPEDSLDQGLLEGRLHGLRLVVTLLAVWGTNFTFALSTTAVSTLSPQIAGHFEHIELSSYIVSYLPELPP
jgi:hypothetical protein